MARSPKSKATRTETDSFGPIEVPSDRYWGAQTQRSRQNFRIGTDRMPTAIVHALGVVKLAAAGRCCRGQLEHVASGRRQSFGSARELIEVLRRGGEEGTP